MPDAPTTRAMTATTATNADTPHPNGVNPNTDPSMPIAARSAATVSRAVDADLNRPASVVQQSTDHITSTYSPKNLSATGRCVHHNPLPAMIATRASHGVIASNPRITGGCADAMLQRTFTRREMLITPTAATMPAPPISARRYMDDAPGACRRSMTYAPERIPKLSRTKTRRRPCRSVTAPTPRRESPIHSARSHVQRPPRSDSGGAFPARRRRTNRARSGGAWR